YNDFGRPFGEGFNSVDGFSARATSGPLFFYFRGEFQHAPASPPFSQPTVALISKLELNPPNQTLLSPVDSFHPLDAYLGLAFAGQQLSLGQQSLSWGPGTSPFMLSNNAE